MKKMTVLVKQVLMSTLTVGMIAMSTTACSDMNEMLPEGSAPAEKDDIVAKTGDGLMEPIGLVYTDFINENDVQILNADTTEIAISKALADKKGITNFVNHPMGIWQSLNERAYLRRATSQKLVGDRYVLTVVRSGLGEILAAQDAELNTSIYVNPNAAKTRGAASADKYTDSRNVIHPVAVTITRLPGEAATTRSAFGPGYGTLTAEQILNGETFDQASAVTRGYSLEDLYDIFVNFVKNGARVKGENTGHIMELEGTLTPPKIQIKTGENKGDTLTINSKIPYKFQLDYTVKLDAKVKGALRFPLPFDIDCNYFEGRLDGNFKIAPEMTLGIGAKLELPKEKQNYKICDMGEFHFTFMAGFVPVDICLQPNLTAHIEASVEGKVYTGIKYEYESEFSAGVKYQNGWKPIGEHKVKKNDLSIITPRGTFKANAGIGLLLGCDVLVDLLAGPTVSVGPMIKAGFEAKFAPFEKVPFTFETGIKAGVYGRAGAKVKLWRIELFDWETDLTFGPEWNIWSFKYDGKNQTSTGGNDKLTEQVEEMKQQVAAEVEAAKTKQAEDEIRKANEPENKKHFWYFKQSLSKDSEIQNQLNQLYFRLRNDRGLADRIYLTALDETYEYAVATYTVITPQNFEKMKTYLYNHIYEGTKKAGL